MRNVLIVEDDTEISNLLKIHLTDLDCRVKQAYDGEEGLGFVLTGDYDLIILDIMLPKMDGFEVCREIRKKEIYSPIMMLTSKSDETDKVLGLEFGADDYLTKPFGIRELIARVKAIFRRSEAMKKDEGSRPNLDYGDLTIDVENRKVSLKGARIELTPKEFELLYLLASHPGRTYDRETILTTVWGYQYDGYEHTVNSHINRLRGKIEEDIARPRYIITTWGVGYRFNDKL